MTSAIDTSSDLKRTPLYAAHQTAGGRLVPFAGWEMPVQYAGVIAEHTAVRTAAGMFDVSHMGEVMVEGSGATDFLQHRLSNDITKLEIGTAQYTLLMNEEGGIDDDLIAYQLGPDQFLLVVNAANAEQDFRTLKAAAPSGVSVKDVSNLWAMIAVQGPTAFEAIATALGVDLRGVGTFQAVQCTLGGLSGMAATTGYTGEEGCELLIDPAVATDVWDRLLAVGVTPCGLGARDTLRLEVCYSLHGNDIGPDTNPISARLGWACALGTGFVGEEHVAAMKTSGAPTKLVPILASERGVPRQGLEVRSTDGAAIGRLTSGTQSPTLGQGIGLAYLDAAYADVGTDVVVDVRGRDLPAQVVSPPFITIPRRDA